ncbi:hypothetical protein FOMG_18774 [Fusarium oxysporum f. sp. melonis 26406]|uniref:Uncharacterized protein n=1 Tax=Fusarium oxysporum f. sp. melonis 26406 TaxID=1089452 RepID=W9YZH8_FUSOX|nr:hypothetical protein FOMG_18774 [Fusarium oxysporum f. sp. melonis 26406]
MWWFETPSTLVIFQVLVILLMQERSPRLMANWSRVLRDSRTVQMKCARLSSTTSKTSASTISSSASRVRRSPRFVPRRTATFMTMRWLPASMRHTNAESDCVHMLELEIRSRCV